jgi:hypothetical protein
LLGCQEIIFWSNERLFFIKLKSFVTKSTANFNESSLSSHFHPSGFRWSCVLVYIVIFEVFSIFQVHWSKKLLCRGGTLLESHEKRHKELWIHSVSISFNNCLRCSFCTLELESCCWFPFKSILIIYFDVTKIDSPDPSCR